ncbi:tumor protein D53 homolog isoform X6 [Petromyzon marinus]|uniref:Tumor protein D53 homolog isoform X6 n=1 Tax=Petromyzon marinus TaxID=7757 RepID=A0AAJ7X192_PETMA|nr:tumor protein D53 homolog isoform X6 [Petromyzon marinus]
MEAVQQGLLDPDTMQEVAVDPVPAQDGACSVSSAEREELEAELAKVEEEISTLRQVLTAKERHAAEIKRKLGLSPLNELRTNLSRGWQDMQATNAYKKTQETLTVAGQKTTSVLSNVGSAITRKLGDMKSAALRQRSVGRILFSARVFLRLLCWCVLVRRRWCFQLFHVSHTSTLGL